jgi:predicted outer membrane repeat protein
MIADASLTLLNSTISGNYANLSGGGIYAVNGTIMINNSTIAYNTSVSSGGGITQGSATVSPSVHRIIILLERQRDVQ